MQTTKHTVIDLEKRFWQTMVDDDAGAALQMLGEPALMVSQHGTFKFDHAAYRRMAENGPMTLKAFELHDVDVLCPSEETAILSYRATQTVQKRDESATRTEQMYYTSTWVRKDAKWLCVAHTEVPASAGAQQARH